MTNEELVEMFGNMKVSDMVDLTKMLEEKFGVSADRIIVGGPVIEEVEDSGPEFVSVILTGHGDSKIAVVKEIRAITGMGLKESMAVVNEVPSTIQADMEMEPAKALEKRLIDVGASVEIK